MIEVTNLSKRYGEKKAVDVLSFTLNKGEILGLLGPNGAGKTTAMNIITGCTPNFRGTVKVNGYDILKNPHEAKRCMGYLPEQPPLYLDMTVDEYLRFVYLLKKAKMPLERHLFDVKEMVKIRDMGGRLIKNLSKGYRQRVGLAQALIGSPSVLVLDEPTVGLDPAQSIEIRTLIKQLGRTRAIILSSHILSEITAVCNRVLIINNGRVAAAGTAEELLGSTDGATPEEMFLKIIGG